MISKEDIEQYTKLGNKILDYFEAAGHEYPEPMLHCYWAYWSGQIVWWDREPLTESELDSPDYSLDLWGTALFERQDYCMACCFRSSEGGTCTILLDSSKRIL